MVGPYDFKLICDRIINAFISSGIIIVIMIKSAGPEHNIYRIIKTLSNQDYLAIDQQKHHFILSQNTHLHQPQPHRHQQGSFHLPVPPKHKQSRIITHKDHLVIEESTYYLFETGTAAIVWAKDIPSKQLQSPKFIFDLVKQAILNILEGLLWFSPEQTSAILHPSNFWLFNGSLHLLAMQRSAHSMKKTQPLRAYSLKPSSISCLMDKQMQTIKRFADILWDIVSSRPFAISEAREFDPSKTILTKMINKQLTFNEIVAEIEQLSQSLFNSRNRKSVSPSPFKDSRSRRRHSEPIVLPINSKRYSGNSSKICPRLQLRAKSEQREVTQGSTLRPADRVGSSIGFSQATLLQQVRSTCLESKKNRQIEQSLRQKHKQSALTPNKTPIRRVTNQTDRNKYLNWLKVNNNSIVFSRLARKGQPLKKQPSEISIQEKELKQRLLSKVNKYRESRYCRQIYTQTPNSQEQMTKGRNGVVDEGERKQGEGSAPTKTTKTDMLPSISDSEELPLESKSGKVKERSIKISINHIPVEKPSEPTMKKTVLNEISRKLDFQQINPTPSKIPFAKQYFELLKPDQKPSSSFWKQDLSSIQHSNIKEVNFSQKNVNRHPPPPEQSRQNLGKASPKKKVKNADSMKRLSLSQQKEKSGSKQMDVDVSELETINFTTLQNPSEQPQPDLSLELSPSLHNSQQKPTNNETFGHKNTKKDNQIVSEVQEQVIEFANMINILADVSIYCVKNKDKLGRFQWRTSIFFLYQRFYQERINFIQGLKENRAEAIVRRHQTVHPQALQLWNQKESRREFIDQMEKENSNIALTYERFSKKTLQEAKLQPSIERFIRNRDAILISNKDKTRSFLGKYAIAFIINEFDQALERSNNTPDEIGYISRCIFALRIVSELDGKEEGRSPVSLDGYSSLEMSLDKDRALVEHLYDLYYPQQSDDI